MWVTEIEESLLKGPGSRLGINLSLKIFEERKS